MPPNILFIVTDDHQSDAIGAAGSTVVQTPVLDALAARGMRFSRAALMGSILPAVCSPARASLLTGMNPFAASLASPISDSPAAFTSVRPDLPTLPGILGSHGYQTFITGKWHNDRAALLRSFKQGEAIFLNGMCDHDKVPVNTLEGIRNDTPATIGEGFSTTLFCDAAIRLIDQTAKDRPFFGWLALTSPHDPRTPPAVYRAQYRPEDLPLPANFKPEPTVDNGELHVRDEMLVPKPLQPDRLREELADYYGMITHQDAEIGRVLDHLAAKGRLGDTIIVYIGDHGLALGRHGLLGKQNMYEHSLRTPFIMAGPGVPLGSVNSDLVYSYDVVPTLLKLAAVSFPGKLDGRDLSQAHWGTTPTSEHPQERFHFYKDLQRALTTKRWKLIEYRTPRGSTTELFDLQTDPLELNNRADDPDCRSLLNDLRHRLVREQHRWGDQLCPLSSAHSMPPFEQ